MNHRKYIKKEYLLDQMSKFVSSRFGLIEETWFREDPVLKCPTALSRVKSHLGLGTDLDCSTAIMKSMAEALERYTLKYYCPITENSHTIHQKTCKEIKNLGYICFYPDAPLYEESVYKNFSFCKKVLSELKTDWAASKRFSDNQLVWLPASLIYYNVHKKLTNVLKSPTSNGMACSFFHPALEASLLELIERDTFLYMWLAKSPGEEIVFDKIQNESLSDLLDIISCKIKQIKVIYKYTDTQIPSLFVLFRGKKIYNEPAFLIVGAADTDIERGCYRALMEFVQSYNNFFYNSRIWNRIKEIQNESNPKLYSFMDHSAFYTIYENFHKCEFLFNISGDRKLSELSQKWPKNYSKKEKGLLKRLLKDKNIFIANVTPPEIKQSALHIVRAYSPDLMDIDYRDDQLFSASLRKKRIDKINAAFNKKTDCLNPDPHCYP